MNFLRKLPLFLVVALIMGFGFLAAISIPLSSVEVKATEAETFVGRAEAPVTLIEYGSLTCHHCAVFQNDVYPAIKTNYINTGKVRYIFRSLPTPPASLSVGLQVIADCAGPQRYAVIDAYFGQQDQLMASARQAGGALDLALSIANRASGLSAATARQCIADQSRAQAIFDIAQAGTAQFALDHTPTLIINGEKFEVAGNGEYTVANLSAALDAAYRIRVTQTTTKTKPRQKKK
jgi:protein-disulfide isomerase